MSYMILVGTFIIIEEIGSKHFPIVFHGKQN